MFTFSENDRDFLEGMSHLIVIIINQSKDHFATTECAKFFTETQLNLSTSIAQFKITEYIGSM